MDPDEIRRKRRRLFSNSASNWTLATGTSSSAVIDLTESSPEPDTQRTDMAAVLDDEAFAKRLQAQLDAEEEDQVVYQPAASSSSRGAAKASQPRPDGASLDDEAFARRLQAQWNDENAASSDRTSTTTPVRPGQLVDSRSPTLTPGESGVVTSGMSIESNLRSDEVEKSLHAFYQSIKHLKCRKCQKSMFRYEKDILKHIDSHMNTLPDENRGMTCITCGFVSNLDEDRLISIWLLLCGFDERSKHNKPDKKRKAQLRPRFSSSTNTNGTGYGGPSHRSYGKAASKSIHAGSTPYDEMYPGLAGPFASDAGLQGTRPKSYGGEGRTLADSIDQLDLSEDDKMTAKVLDCLTILLPSFEKQSQFDLDPPAGSLQCMLLSSSFLERAAELLSNNNVEEVIKQAKLYTSLVCFLRTLAQHPSSSILVLRERVVRSPGVSILKVSLGKANLVSTAEHETTRPLVKSMRDLSMQCKTMMRTPETNETLLQTFHAIVELNDFLVTNAGEASSASADKNAWQKDLAVSEVLDEVLIARHSLVAKEEGTENMHRGRMTRIMQEIARLEANLPPGIFVRYASSRPDVMKVMITGPKDTPYENGLFEFDLLCGAKFPHEPPKMDFRTTAGGTVHFNPNLYSNGKVCLSLLGTWAGESWDPKQSTLLQVLVSIQAMIFCENPWNNEPGRENIPNSDFQSKAYNRSLYPHTVQAAMLDWLDRRRFRKSNKYTDLSGLGPMQRSAHHEPSGEIDKNEDMWDEVVKHHFETNADEIIATVTKWVADKPPPPGTTQRAYGAYTPSAPMPAPIPTEFPWPSGAPLFMQAIYPNGANPSHAFAKSYAASFGGNHSQHAAVASSVPVPQLKEVPTAYWKPADLVGYDLAAKLRDGLQKLRSSNGRYNTRHEAFWDYH
ncbi:Putative ubiquitin-conjugating enzyme E2, ubiquitin-conjugating enzyme/RWD [Septoria linicola]|uniref:Ubiquitin-conjugating enzyme E2, ubiquitin-conjugating enzyme/RWD n=1 Tax=Septoria linicola TaxID=215465 RepID=A0A9Q9EP27_9PEZI|nr:Putative ubiquitin-conjugating enzyme E2, ubiquitin-conjugating enzyme/RWD [Septoria linicola]